MQPIQARLEAVAEDLVFLAPDNYPLSARIWHTTAARPKVAVLINAGAGISYRYYDRFAEYIASNGATVMIYDYRGIGKSRPRSLRGFSASVEDWGSKDCTAAIALLHKRDGEIPVVVIGHSVGGFLTGFVRNGQLINRLILVAAHTGYWRDYSKARRQRMYALWHVLMPALTRVFGFFPGRLLGVSEDIPAGAALEWANRRHPEFWWNVRTASGELDADRIEDAIARFRAIRAPTFAIRFSDDPFATLEGTQRILGLFFNCPTELIVLGPEDTNNQPIGHFGFFRATFRETLWPMVLSRIVEAI
ncbi:MAG: alpha/beta fold hydrolase [Casimicrobiaceae bacterium]